MGSLEAHPFEGCRNKAKLLPHVSKAIGNGIRKYPKVSNRPIQFHAGKQSKKPIENFGYASLYGIMAFLASHSDNKVVALLGLGIEARDILWCILQVAVHDDVPVSARRIDSGSKSVVLSEVSAQPNTLDA